VSGPVIISLCHHQFVSCADITRLIKYDTFSEDVCKFYIAQCVLAIEAVHALGFIHR
jgi:serine/threonine protein kinase